MTTDIVKTYSSKSNAKRAAIKAGIEIDKAELIISDEGFAYVMPNAPAVEVMETEYEPIIPNGALGSLVSQCLASPTKEERRRVPRNPAKATSTNGQKIEKDRPEQNGVKRPSAGGVCRSVWDFLDASLARNNSVPTAADVKAEATKQGWNANNASIELYQWRKFNGISGRVSKASK